MLRLRMMVSPMVTVVAWTLTSTSLSQGVGFSASCSRSTSGGPYLVYTIAFMRFLQIHGVPGARRHIGCGSLGQMGSLRLQWLHICSLEEKPEDDWQLPEIKRHHNLGNDGTVSRQDDGRKTNGEIGEARN